MSLKQTLLLLYKCLTNLKFVVCSKIIFWQIGGCGQKVDLHCGLHVGGLLQIGLPSLAFECQKYMRQSAFCQKCNNFIRPCLAQTKSGQHDISTVNRYQSNIFVRHYYTPKSPNFVIFKFLNVMFTGNELPNFVEQIRSIQAQCVGSFSNSPLDGANIFIRRGVFRYFTK